MRTRLFYIAISGLLLAALLWVGCDRTIESKDPVRSLPDRLEAPTNLTIAVGDREVTLSWEMADTSGVVRYRIYTAEGLDGTFVRHDSSTNRTAAIDGLAYNQSVRFRVTAVGGSGAESGSSETVTAVVGLLSALINDDNMYTSSRDVQVLLTVPGSAAYVMLSEDPLFAGAVTRPFRSAMSFTLSQGDGPKTVYAKITFSDGSESAGTISDDIILDTYAAIDSVYFAPTGTTFAPGDVIAFNLEAGGELDGVASVSFLGTDDIVLADDGSHGDAAADDGLYTFDFTVPTGLTVNDQLVTGRFTDAAGNQASSAVAAERLKINAASLPDSVTLAVGLIDETTARLSWTKSNEENFSSYRVYRDSSTPVTLSDDLITIITDRNTLSYNDYLPNPGIYHYRVYVFDTQEQYAGSNEVSITR